MLVVHADMKRVLGEVGTRGDPDVLAGYFAGLIGRMARGGAQLAAISAITPHICIRESTRLPLPLVNIVSEINDSEIRVRRYRRVALSARASWWNRECTACSKAWK